MALRRDPMSAAAEAISAVEGTCLGRTDELGGVEVEGEALVCTVGSIRVHPNQVSSKGRSVHKGVLAQAAAAAAGMATAATLIAPSSLTEARQCVVAISCRLCTSCHQRFCMLHYHCVTKRCRCG